MLSGLIHRCKPGQIQVVICSDPLALIPALQPALLQDNNKRLTTQIWQALPTHEHLLNDVLHQLSSLALSVWPAWYSGPLATAGLQAPPIERLPDEDPAIRGLKRSLPRLSLPWLKQAATSTARGAAPLLSGFNRTVQCEQLALALDLSNGIVVMGVTGTRQSDDRLQSLARVCSWLAQTTNARVFVVIPPELASTTALDSITYQAQDLTSLEAAGPAGTGSDEETYRLWPIQGQPHPCSPGEQLLAARLAADEELAGMFRFNLLVPTVLGTSWLVDLLWANGKLIVEVDGYHHHGGPVAFCQDRQRDYELMVSGYLVLRLPHSEVMGEVEAAIAKIRHAVRFRRQQMASVMPAKP